MNPPFETASCNLDTEFGRFVLHGFKESTSGLEHAAMAVGNLLTAEPVLTRVHSECLTGDAFHSLHCDCGKQLQASLQAITDEGRGVLLYLRQEGRGIGLINKIRAYRLQEAGADTVDANRMLGLPDDARDYGVAARILTSLGAKKIRLLTNNPAKVAGLAVHGIDVVERLPLEVGKNGRNAAYMATKAARMNHLLGALAS
jgi:GTP cyclohydrolase II